MGRRPARPLPPARRARSTRSQPAATRNGRTARGFAAVVLFARFLIVPGVAAAAAAAWLWLPGVSVLPESGVQALLPANTPAARAEQEAARLFGSSLLPRIAVVQRNPRGLPPAQQRRIAAVALRLDQGTLPGFPHGARALPYINTGRLLPGAREQSTTAITYLGFPTAVPVPDQRDLADRYARIASLPGAPAAATGFIPGSLAQSDAIDANLHWVELATVLVVALIIGLYLRSLLAPLVTLAAAGAAYLIAIGVISWLAKTQGVAVQNQVEPIVVVLLLGLVTDYSVFFLAGMRSRLRAGEQPRRAARNATAEVAPIVLTAGLLVAAGLATLRLASIGFVAALGPAMAIVVLISLAVSLSFVPAAMGILGRSLFWPGPRDARTQEPLTTRGGNLIRRGLARGTSIRLLAFPTVLLATAALLVASGGLAQLRLALTPIRALDPASPPAHAAWQAEQGFTAGIIAPTEIILRAPGIGRRQHALRRLAAGLRDQPEIGALIGPGLLPLPKRYRPVFATRAGDTVRYFVAFRHHPYSSSGIDDLTSLQHAMPQLLAAARLDHSRVLYAGDTPLAQETIGRIHHDLLWIGLAAAAVNLALLALFLRALIAPILLLASSILGITATFGLTALIFRYTLHDTDLTYFVPLAVGVLLLSFGTDYNLFIVSHIRRHNQDKPMKDAIRAAVPAASRAISIAGLALAGSFATLAIVPIAPFRELALATSLGVLIDTFLVRTLLIPALLTTAGNHTWWPDKRANSRRRSCSADPA